MIAEAIIPSKEVEAILKVPPKIMVKMRQMMYLEHVAVGQVGTVTGKQTNNNVDDGDDDEGGDREATMTLTRLSAMLIFNRKCCKCCRSNVHCLRTRRCMRC